MFLYKNKKNQTNEESNKNKTLTTVQPSGVCVRLLKLELRLGFHQVQLLLSPDPEPHRSKLKYVLAPVLSPGTAAQAHELSRGPHLFYQYVLYLCICTRVP